MSTKQAAPRGARSPQLSRRKRIVFWFLILVVQWLVVDTAAYALLRARPYLFFETAKPTPEDIASFRERLYHPHWGWNLQPPENRGSLGERRSREYDTKDVYTIKTFGDSFTQGAGENDETFQYLVEEATGWECLNYGVGAYGTDQAVMKYIDTPVPTRYTILAVLDENIGRVVANSWLHYRAGAWWPKPSFRIEPDGTVKRMPNPAPETEVLERMADPGFRASLREGDYWYRYQRERRILDELSWPATPIVVRNLGMLLRRFFAASRQPTGPPDSYEAGLSQWSYYHLYQEGSEGIRIMREVVDLFAATARERGETPIIVVFPTLETMHLLTRFGRKPYQSLLDHVTHRGLPLLDFGDVFSDEEWIPYYDGPTDHFGPVGNRRVAAEIVSLITELEERSVESGGAAAPQAP